MTPVRWRTKNATIHIVQDLAKSALDRAMLATLYASCSSPAHAAACCDEMQPESTPFGVEHCLSVAMVRMGMQHAQLPSLCDGRTETNLPYSPRVKRDIGW